MTLFPSNRQTIFFVWSAEALFPPSMADTTCQSPWMRSKSFFTSVRSKLFFTSVRSPLSSTGRRQAENPNVKRTKTVNASKRMACSKREEAAYHFQTGGQGAATDVGS